MCSDSGGNGQSSSNQVIECKGCVCGLAVFNIILAILGLIFSSISENAFMSLCMGSAYGGGYGYGFGSSRLLVAGGEELPMMSLLHELKNGGQLEVGGFLSDLSDVEAMRSPFMAPSKPPSPSAALSRKPAFMAEHATITRNKNALLATCPSPWPTVAGTTRFAGFDTEHAIALSKWIVTASELTAGGLSAGTFTKFKIRGYPSSGTQTFSNFQAGLKAVTYTTPAAGTSSVVAFTARDCDATSTSGTLTLNNEKTWTEITLSSGFVWDGVTNIEVSLYHGTNSPYSSYSNYGLMVKTLPSSHTTNVRYVKSTAATLTDLTWTANAGTSIGSGSYVLASTAGLQIEFVTPGCTSQDLDEPDCSSISGCSQCTARVDCAFLANSYGTTVCRSQSYKLQLDAAGTSYTETTVCPRSCSSYSSCHECRNETRDHTCYWAQKKNAEDSGDFSGSCSDTYTDRYNATFMTNSTCQSPEAVAQLQSSCSGVAALYNPGIVGYVFLLIGATLQLLGVCSWCGVRPEARANLPLLCTGCNIHWVAGLVLVVWGVFWLAVSSALLSFAFGLVFIFFLPCLLAPCAGAIGISSICPSKTATGPMPQSAPATQVPVEEVEFASQPPFFFFEPLQDAVAQPPPPATQLYQIEVPQGKDAGDTFQANVGGRVVEIAVPKGSSAGSLIQVQV